MSSVRVNRVHQYGRGFRKYFFEMSQTDAVPVTQYAKPAAPVPPRVLTPLDRAVAAEFNRQLLASRIGERVERYSRTGQKRYAEIVLECQVALNMVPRETGSLADRIVQRHERYARAGIHKSFDDIRCEFVS